jgi:Fe(3+) dicitrate transport protein
MTLHARPSVPFHLARSLWQAGLCAAVFCAPVAVYAQATPEAIARDYDIPAGPLARVLNQFARAAGIALSADAALTDGRHSAGLQGRFTPQQGLSRLLEGSGLEPVELRAGAYGLRLAPAASATAAAAPAADRTATDAPAGMAAPDATAEAAMPSITIVGDWLSNPSSTTVFDHPGARDLVTREQFPAQGSTSVREAISRIPGVNAPENNGTGSHDMAMNIGIRGLNPRLTTRATVLIDGIPFPFAPYGQPQLSFAPVTLGNLDAVDVVRGGGAVRYGPQNVGGIINFVTRRIPKEFTASAGLQTSFFSGSSQSSPKTSTHVLLGTTLDSGLGFAFLYSGTRGSDWREHSKTKIDDVILKANYKNGAHTAHAMVQRYEGKADMPGGLTVADHQRDPWQSTRLRDNFWGHRNLYTAGYEYAPSAQQRFSVKAFRTETLRSGYLDQGNTGLTLSPRDYTVNGVETRFSQGLQLGGVQHEIGIGHRYVSETSHELRYKVPLNLGRNPNTSDPFDRDTQGETKANAFFIDDRITIGAWTITPGLRYERIRSGQDNLINGVRYDANYNTVLPSLNVAYAGPFNTARCPTSPPAAGPSRKRPASMSSAPATAAAACKCRRGCSSSITATNSIPTRSPTPSMRAARRATRVWKPAWPTTWAA